MNILAYVSGVQRRVKVGVLFFTTGGLHFWREMSVRARYDIYCVDLCLITLSDLSIIYHHHILVIYN